MELLVCLESLSSCITQVLLSLRSNWWPDILLQDFLIECRIHDSFDVWQVVQLLKIQSTPDHHHHVWLLVWCSFDEMLCWFFIRCNGTRTFKKYTFVASVLRIFAQKSWGLSSYLLTNVRRAFVFFLVSCLLPWKSPMDAQSLSYCWIMNTHLNWGMWGLQFFRCCPGFFYDLLDESSFHSWSNFGRSGTPGKVHHYSKFSPFVDNGSDRGSLESQSLRNGFATHFQTDKPQLFCFASVL